MFAVQHLQRQLKERQEDYELLSEKIQGLRKSKLLATNPAEQFMLRKLMEETEAERESIAQKIGELEASIELVDVETKLYNALLKLNYHSQEKLFHQMIHNAQVGAFLIHGEPECGQRWLLNRLLKQVPCITNAKIVPINLQFRGRRCDLDSLQREFRRQTGLTSTHSFQEVVEQVHGWWQTQTVILILHNVDTMDSANVKDLIQHFWQPLVKKSVDIPCQSPSYRLVVFLIDNGDSMDTCPFEVAEYLDASWESYLPIKPPKLASIHIDELVNWKKYECAALPAKILQMEVEEILRNSSQGIPELLLAYLCELCDCNWYEKEHSWIRY